MKITPFFYPLTALLAVASPALADISLGSPSVPVSEDSATYHVDLLSSNAVRAEFKEIRSIPVVKLDAEPSTEDVAVFEVKQTLAHRRYDRMGDGELKPGKLFSISLAADVPGQDAELGGFLRGLQAGDEALLNIDHIYIFREDGNENVRSCTRFVKIQSRQDIPTVPTENTADAAAPVSSPLPVSGSSRQVFTHVTIEPDGQGGMRQMKIVEQRERTADGKEIRRKFINDVEVDPQTDQPLPLSSPAQPPAPQQVPPASDPRPAEQQPGSQESPHSEPPIPDPKAFSDDAF